MAGAGNISPSNTLPQPSSTQVVDNQYWIRLSLGNNIHGTESVRDVLRNDMKISNDGKLVHSWLAATKLKKPHPNIAPFVWEHLLGPCKSECTRPCNGETNIDDLDITSLEKIFNFAEKIIPADVLSEADIINVKEYHKTSMESVKNTRDFLSRHSLKNEILKQEFDERWKKLRDMLVGTGYKQLKRFDELKTCSLDPYLKEQVLVINDYLKILDDTKCNKRELKDYKAEIEKKLEDFIKEQKQINKKQELFDKYITRSCYGIAPVAWWESSRWKFSTNNQTNQESELTAKSNRTWDGTTYRSFEWNGKTYTFKDVESMLLGKQFDTLKPMLDNILFVIESLRDDDDEHDVTLLMDVAWWSLFPLFQFLLPYVRDFNCVDVSGRNVAHYIAVNNDVGVEMFELIEKKVTRNNFHHIINKLDVHDNSPLHEAAYENKHNTIKYLIANGANVNVRSKGGKYPDEQDECDDETKRIIRQYRN